MSPLDRARLSLDGLSVGDAFGQMFFFGEDAVLSRVLYREALPGPWYLTDDSIMAIAIVRVLKECGEIDPDRLADLFAENFRRDPLRGYGAGAMRILHQIGQGDDWETVSRGAFGGSGSFGNGAAMRVAPLGAYFADDLDAVTEQASRSAVVTHAHPEGEAGAIAIAHAAAWAWNHRRFRDDYPADEDHPDFGQTMLHHVVSHTPTSSVREGIETVIELGPAADLRTVVAAVGNGSKISAPDTVPLVLWIAARSLNDYETALWTAVEALGDRDTTCAMIGGILALRNGAEAIPEGWRTAREPLEEWMK